MSEQSSEVDDSVEFSEIAVADRDEDKGWAGGVMPKDPFDDGTISSTSQKENGAYVQYALNGPGFVPTTKTIATLAPGAYRIQAINDIWSLVPHKFVTDDLLRLPDSKSDAVVKEIEHFWTLKEKFKSFGFTHKRGFLLYGKPGSGKTCTVSIVMKKMIDDGGIVVFADCNPSLVSTLMNNLRQIEPNRQLVIVMEDLDTIIDNYGESDVLSLLDGEYSIDNVVYIATTNYPEKLDGRMTNRPSRFDKIVKIGMPNAAARKMYIDSRKLGLPDAEIDKWVELTDAFSIAHIKELIIGVCCFGNNLDNEVLRLRAMATKPKSAGEKAVGFGVPMTEE